MLSAALRMKTGYHSYRCARRVCSRRLFNVTFGWDLQVVPLLRGVTGV